MENLKLFFQIMLLNILFLFMIITNQKLTFLIDTYIEKDAQINEQIDRMRHSATQALLERDDVIIVASVSCIYGIGSVETYSAMTQDLRKGNNYELRKIVSALVEQQYRRNDQAFQRGTFRLRGDVLEIWPAHLESRAGLSFLVMNLKN